MADPDDHARERIRAAARLFNERRFFEAHDVLEEEWAAARGARRLPLQALVKVAAGMYHLQTSNPVGAESLLSSGLDALRRAAGASDAVAVGGGVRIALSPVADPVASAVAKLRAAGDGAPPAWGPEDLPRLSASSDSGTPDP